MSADLQRFIDAQEGVFDQALAEIRQGRKRTHWIWFVFPQLVGLGQSARSVHYGIRGLDEARAYLAHPVLGPRLEQATACVLQCPTPAPAVFGDLDYRKFVSSMTLFALAAPPGSVFQKALDTLGERDGLTLQLLGRH